MFQFIDSKKIALIRKPPARPPPWIHFCRPFLERLENREVMTTLGFDAAFNFAVDPEVPQAGHVFVGEQQAEAGAMGIQPLDDKVVLAGHSLAAGEKGKFQVVRLLASNGNPDTDFSGDGVVKETFIANRDVRVNDLVIDGSGRIVLAISIALHPHMNPPFEFGIMRFLPDGTPDLDSNAHPKGIDVDDQGRIVIGGRAQAGTTTHCAVARYDDDGEPDQGFGVEGKLTFYADVETAPCSIEDVDAYRDPVTQQDLVLLSGHVGAGTGDKDFAAFRLCESGAFDAGCSGTPFGEGNGKRRVNILGPGLNDGAFDMIRQDDGYFVLVGDTDGAFPESTDLILARFKPNADGTNPLDTDPTTGFGNGAGFVTRGTYNHIVGRGVARRSDGTYAVAGYATNAGGFPGKADFYVGLFAADGTFLDEEISQFDYTSGDADQAHAVGVDGQGRIVAGGFHTHLGPEEPPGFGPPSQSFGAVRFAAIRLLVLSSIPPPGGGFDLEELGQSAIGESDAALVKDSSDVLQGPTDRGATDLPVSVVGSAATRKLPPSFVDDTFIDAMLTLREEGLD